MLEIPQKLLLCEVVLMYRRLIMFDRFDFDMKFFDSIEIDVLKSSDKWVNELIAENGPVHLRNSGDITQEKRDFAELYWKSAADSGNSDCQYKLSLLYLVQRKYELAEKYFIPSANNYSSYFLHEFGRRSEGQKKLIWQKNTSN